MRYIAVLMMIMLLVSASHANDGKIAGKVWILGTSLYDDDANGGTPDVEMGQILLDESDPTWDEDMDGDSDTFSDDCAISMYFNSNMIDLSSDGGKAMYSALLSAQATGLATIIEYEEDGNGACIVKTVLTLPASSLP